MMSVLDQIRELEAQKQKLLADAKAEGLQKRPWPNTGRLTMVMRIGAAKPALVRSWINRRSN